MTEGLTVDGAAVEVAEQAFNAAMAAPEPSEPLAAAPAPAAPADPEAPFGRASDGTPKAPYGVKPDGTVKRSAGGRKPKDRHDRARVQDAASAVRTAPSAAAGAPDYRTGIGQLLGTAWAVTAPFMPADAGAILAATPALTEAWSALAAHDPRVGKVVRVLTEGSVYGAAISATLMVGLQIAANHGKINPQAVAGFGVRTVDDLEQMNAQALAQVQMAAQGAQAA
jgi:hypothetical protein